MSKLGRCPLESTLSAHEAAILERLARAGSEGMSIQAEAGFPELSVASGRPGDRGEGGALRGLVHLGPRWSAP